VFCALVDVVAAPLVLRADRNEVVSEPVQVVHDLTSSDGCVSVARLVIEAAEGSELTVIHHVRSDDVTGLFLPIVEMDLAPTARVRYVVVQELGPRMVQIASQGARTRRDASLATMAVALGGSYARLRSDAEMLERGGHNEALAVYFGEGEQMHDFRTVQHHVAPRTTSDLVFKGAVEGHARSVYSGLIKIGPDARGTVASQTNRNLVLSRTASAESVPNLEIENNDVKCSHASAVGPIDDEQLYYLESRGVPSDAATRLIVIGFFAELLERVPDPTLRTRLTAAITEKFDRRAQ
jgi:Fe-S cluster assembly protein SufD